jgi:adenosylcobinamide-GDP ribazoletransferase
MAIDEAWLKERAGELKASLLFLTRLRYGSPASASGAALAPAVWAFPIAGVIVGFIGAVVYWLAHRMGLPNWPAAALALAATMAVTGCLHEDGLADTADGFGGGSTRESKLDIMRDSRIGVYGVCALALSVLLRASALASLSGPALVVPALIAAHAAARTAIPVFMYFIPPARSDGLSAAAGRPAGERTALAAALGLVVLVFCLGLPAGLEAIILVAIVVALFGWLSLSQIDGQTGDVLGAVEQVSEIVVLLVALG